MIKTRRHGPEYDPKREERELLNSVVGEQVMHRLGAPHNLIQVQVRRLWQDRYRVNVFVGPDIASAQIPNSFFLVTDGDGNIMASTPIITKQY
jgi:hypothetical protein